MQKEAKYTIEWCPVIKDGKFNIPPTQWEELDLEFDDPYMANCRRIDLCKDNQNNYYRVSKKKE